MKIESVEQLKQLVQIAMDNKLELLEVDNIKIVRTKHDYPQSTLTSPIQTLDEELFGYTSSQGRLND